MPRLVLTEAGYAEALGNYVSVSRADAVAIAKLEAQTLRMRAAQGGPCAPRWRHAARIADKIVARIAAGDGQGAVPYMYQLGRAWHAAAVCKGYPSPLSGDCCHDCHFAYEERAAFPHLPAAARRQLAREHAQLRNAGFPKRAIEAHIRREMALYRKYVPPAVVARIDAEHAALGADDDLASLHAKFDDLMRKQRSIEKWTRYGTYATIGAAIVAAARLGLITIPFIKARKKR